MKKLLIIAAILLSGVLSPICSFAEDMESSTASVGFYVAEEDKGVQYKIDEEGPYLQNFEGYTLLIEGENDFKIQSDINVIHVPTHDNLKITVMNVPNNY